MGCLYKRKGSTLRRGLIASAKRAGMDVRKYLLDVFNRVLDHSSTRLDDLLPGKWDPTTVK